MEIQSENTIGLSVKDQDRIDLNNERAGLENTGRIKRFLTDAFGDSAAKLKKRRERDIDQASLQAMLLNKAYAERYNTVIEKLTEAERSVEIALVKAEAALARLGDQLADMEAAAAKDPDGRAVFYDAEGRARYADGSAVDDVTVAMILTRDDAPSYETWQATQDAAAETEAAIGDLEDIRDNVLAPIRVEMEDEDNPPTTERLEEIEDAVDAASDAAAKVLPATTPSGAGVDMTSRGPSSFAKPDIDALIPG